MTFQDAIKTCFSKYADFNGRASRAEYWWFVLFVFLVATGLMMISQTLSNLFSLAVLLPMIAAGTRRLHDVDRTGWWQLVWFVPAVGWLIALWFLVHAPREPNRFGAATHRTDDQRAV